MIAIVWWQIQSRESFLLRPVGRGALEIDFTLLLGPVLGLLALGLVVLRFFPLAVGLLARLMEPIGPVWLVQGLRRVGRDPIAPGSLVVLLMLATALGVIGSAFGSTLEQSQEDRARYLTGADVRIEHSGGRRPVTFQGLAQLQEEEGNDFRVVEVSRLNGNLLTQGFSSERFTLLAVDSREFARVSWFRPDFAGGSSLPSLMRSIAPPARLSGERQLGEVQIHESLLSGGGPGIALPPDATGLSLWVNPGQPGARLAVGARIRDATGYTFDTIIGEPGDPGWQRISGDLVPGPRRGDPTPPGLTPPFNLINLQLFSRLGLNDPGVIFLDELSAVTPEGEVVVSDFQTPGDWQVVEDFARPGLYALEGSQGVTREGRGMSLAYSWAPGGTGLRGLRPGRPTSPAPAIVSPRILEEADIEVGEVISVSATTFALPVQVVAVADYFPTLDPREQPFIVLDLETLNLFADRHSRRPGPGPNEVWAAAGDEQAALQALTEAIIDRGLNVDQSFLAQEEIRLRVEQPLANASWGGLLALMFLALVLASASGVVLFSYVDTGERRTEFALLRTLGSSAGQLNGMVWFNLLLMVVCGVALGTWAGQQIGTTLLPVLEVSEGGVRVTPPMTLEANWVTLAVAYLALAAVAVANVVWLAWFTARLNVQQVLRAGEGA